MENPTLDNQCETNWTKYLSSQYNILHSYRVYLSGTKLIRVQIMKEFDCVSLHANAFGLKGIIFLSAMDSGKTSFFLGCRSKIRNILE